MITSSNRAKYPYAWTATWIALNDDQLSEYELDLFFQLRRMFPKNIHAYVRKLNQTVLELDLWADTLSNNNNDYYIK
jgi:hypothetical protein